MKRSADFVTLIEKRNSNMKFWYSKIIMIKVNLLSLSFAPIKSSSQWECPYSVLHFHWEFYFEIFYAIVSNFQSQFITFEKWYYQENCWKLWVELQINCDSIAYCIDFFRLTVCVSTIEIKICKQMVAVHLRESVYNLLIGHICIHNICVYVLCVPFYDYAR